MVIPQRIVPVNPYNLAIATGISQSPYSARPVAPPVIQPHMLTHQLRGIGCPGCLGLPPDYGTAPTWGLHGLGQTYGETSLDLSNLPVPSQGSGNTSVLQTAALGLNFVPGVGSLASGVLTTAASMLNNLEKWLGIGAGRTEANLIVPIQNDLVYNKLAAVTNQISAGQSPDLATLLQLYRQVWGYGVQFMEFVLMKTFTDRRASGQALNTVMPYIDGSSGYAVPLGLTAAPTQWNVLTWGQNTLGGPGTNGMLGSLGRAIQNAGGTVQTLVPIAQAANQGVPSQSFPSAPGTIGGIQIPATIMGVSTPLAVVIGLGALYLYKKGSF